MRSLEKKLVSTNEIVKRTIIEKSVLLKAIRNHDLSPTKIVNGNKPLYDAKAIENIVDGILERYQFNKLNRMTRHEFFERGGNISLLEKIPLFKTDDLERVAEFKGCRYIYDRNACEEYLYLNSANQNKELINLKNAAKLLDMASFKIGVALIKEVGLKRVSTENNNNIFFLKKDVQELKESVKRISYKNIQLYYTLYDLREKGLIEAEIKSITCVPLTLIDKVKHFKNCSVGYSKNAADELLKNKLEKDTRDWVVKNHVYSVLGLASTHKLDSIVSKYNIRVKKINAFTYFYKDDIENLKKIMFEKYSYHQENYYTREQSISLGVTEHALNNLNKKTLKPIDKVFEYQLVKVLYSKKDIEILLKDKEQYNSKSYYLLKQIEDIFPFEGNVRRILKVNSILPVIHIGNKNLWSKTDIDQFIIYIQNQINYLDDNYLTIHEATNILGVSKLTIDKYLIRMKSTETFYKVPLQIRIGNYLYVDTLISKNLVQNLEIYIQKIKSEEELLEETKKEIQLLKEQELQRAKDLRAIEREVKKDVEVNSNLELQMFWEQKENITLIQRLDQLAINVDNLEYHLQSYDPLNIEKSIFIAKKDIDAFYKTGNFLVNHISQNNLHIPFQRKFFFLKYDVEAFLIEIENSKKLFLENFYTHSEYVDLGGTHHELTKVTPHELPQIYRYGVHKNTINVYAKKDCDQFLNIRDFNVKIDSFVAQITYDLRLDELYEKCINELSIFPLDYPKICKDSWIRNVKKKLMASRGSIKTISKKFKSLIMTTKLLCETIKCEITEVSTKMLNTFLENNDYPLNSRTEIYIWLKIVSREYTVKFNYKRLINIHERTRKANEVESVKNPSYTKDEFLALLKFVSNVDFHKQRTYEELESVKDYRRKYYAYESVWLYVMLHLNNGWRSQSFVETIPRITLPDHLNTFEKFKLVNLTIEDAQRIVWEFTSKIVNIQHSKNDKKNFFFCSEEMLYPLANALILCELKCRVNKFNTNKLIYLDKDDQLSYVLHRDFFKDFPIPNFKFISLRANHTFIKYSSLIFNQTLKNTMSISRLIRNHRSYDTTNIYTDIDDIQLNLITHQLFNINYFGYSYTIFKKYISNDTNFIKSKVTNIDYIKDIKTLFGDVHKIEHLAIQINVIEKNFHSLIEYLNILNSDQLNELDSLLQIGALPAKESHFQCILGDCIYENQKKVSCTKCPFAIPHFYALTKITKDSLELMKKYKSKSSNSFGEKVHLANLIFKNLVLISGAKKIFGEKILAAFLGVDYSELLKEINELEDINLYKTVDQVGGYINVQ